MSSRLNHPRSDAFFRPLLVYCCIGPLALACGGTSDPPPNQWPKGNVVFMDANNYTSETSLTIPVVPTAAGADLDICWGDLMKDLLCHDIVAPSNGVDNVGFLKIPNMTRAEASEFLAIGKLDENLVTTYGEFHAAQATGECAKLSQFKLGKSIVPATDYVAPAANMDITYMLLFTKGTTPGVGSKAMVFLDPTASSTATSVAAIDACSTNVLHFEATLGQAMPISATDSSKWHVDWSQITKDSFGNTIDLPKLKIDKALLGFYQGRTAADLQTNFKDIEQIATTLYEVVVPVGARDVKLGDAKARGTNAAFTGFTETDGTWAMAVQCSKCQVPAPILLSILTPTP